MIPEALRPRTLVRFGDADDLLVSGLLEHGEQLARRAAVVEVPVGKGHLLLFAINPDLARLDDRQPSAGVERDSGAWLVRAGRRGGGEKRDVSVPGGPGPSEASWTSIPLVTGSRSCYTGNARYIRCNCNVRRTSGRLQ